jgi:HlyD family secretion protein
MTAAVTIETGRADDVLKVPNAALRFRPTEEAFAALGQKAPEPGQRPQGQAQSARGPQADDSNRRGDGSPRAAVWVLEQNNLKRVPVQVGITDGTQTAIRSADLAPGAHVVTGMSTPSAATTTAPSGSPLLPAGRRGFGGGSAAGSGGRR